MQGDVCTVKTRTLTCFEGFRCIAGACKDSCCIGWEIDVDEDSFQRFQAVEGDFGERLRASIETDPDGGHHYILKEGDRCPFLNEKGLCEQILHCGEDILCEICAQHPRFFRMVGDTQEWGVGLACPEAARLLLSWEKVGLTESVTTLNDPFLDYLLDVRDLLLGIAQKEELSLYQRLGLLLDTAENVQEQMDWGECDSEGILPENPSAVVCAGQGRGWLDRLTELEPIDGEWSQALEDAVEAARLMDEIPLEITEQTWIYENFLIYLLFRYVLKAYDDRDLFYWVRACVWSVLTAELLALGRWRRNGGQLSTADWADVFRILSKEVEYDPDIIEGLDELLEELL